MKAKKYKCIDCGKRYEYTPIKDCPWAHPTICDDCNAKREQAKRDADEAKRMERLKGEIDLLPYADWDCSKGNNSLRNTIGGTVFDDGKMTGKSLWIKGDVGCGKTRSVCFVAKTVIERGGHVRYEHCRKMLSRYSHEFANGSAEKYASGLGSDKRILIIDDYGVGKITDRGAELLYNIADDRLINNLPTWITSNLFPFEISKWFPERKTMQDYAKRIIRRITEQFITIENEG